MEKENRILTLKKIHDFCLKFIDVNKYELVLDTYYNESEDGTYSVEFMCPIGGLFKFIFSEAGYLYLMFPEFYNNNRDVQDRDGVHVLYSEYEGKRTVQLVTAIHTSGLNKKGDFPIVNNYVKGSIETMYDLIKELS